MAHQIKAIYKQAPAFYQLAHEAGCQVATLLFYGGQPQNRPPRRLILVQTPVHSHQLLQQPALTDDISQCRQPGPTTPAADPLFPYKQHRSCVLDQLV
jgi:hypothetical protein